MYCNGTIRISYITKRKTEMLLVYEGCSESSCYFSIKTVVMIESEQKSICIKFYTILTCVRKLKTLNLKPVF